MRITTLASFISLFLVSHAIAETFTARMAENFDKRVGEKDKSQILGIQTANEVTGEFIYCSKVLTAGGYRFENVKSNKFIYTTESDCYNFMNALEAGKTINVNYTCNQICKVENFSAQ